MRKDFYEVAKYAKDQDLYVSIASNGTLITKEIRGKEWEVGRGERRTGPRIQRRRGHGGLV